MIPALLYPGILVYALDGRTHHHAIIQSQCYNDNQNTPVVCIKWVTAPHYGKIVIPCDRLMELPTKRNRFPPSRCLPGNLVVTTTQRVNLKTSRQQRPSNSRNRPPKRVLEWDKTGFCRSQETKRKRSPRRINVISKKRSMGLRERYSPSKCNETLQNRFNVFGIFFYNVEHGENIPHCSVSFCENKQLVRLSCRKSCRSHICIECMKQLLSHAASDKIRCPTCRQQFSPRTFQRIIANYKL